LNNSFAEYGTAANNDPFRSEFPFAGLIHHFTGIFVQRPQPMDLNFSKRDGQQGVWRLSVAQFLVALVLLLLTAPFILDTPEGNLIEAVLFTVVFLSAVLAIGGRRRTLVLAILFVTPVVAGTWLEHFQPNLPVKAWTLAAEVAFSAFVIAQLFRYMLQAPRVDSQVLCAGISTYLMLAMVWAFAYMLVAQVVPSAFVFTGAPEPNRPLLAFDAVYFSFSTLTTLGYGDIVPAAKVARQLAILESTTGTLYVTVLIARLVSLYSTAEPPLRPQ
jgi:Ion channel